MAIHIKYRCDIHLNLSPLISRGTPLSVGVEQGQGCTKHTTTLGQSLYAYPCPSHMFGICYRINKNTREWLCTYHSRVRQQHCI